MSIQPGHCTGARLESFELLLLVGYSPMQRGFVGAADQVTRKLERETAKAYRQVY
jgi:hypothetical protein